LEGENQIVKWTDIKSLIIVLDKEEHLPQGVANFGY